MLWTVAETAAVDLLKTAFEDAGFKDGRDDDASSSDTLFFRDFIDDASLQKGASYVLYIVQPQAGSYAGDNEKIGYTVEMEIILATTYPTDNAITVSFREAFEEELQNGGFISRFTKSAFDPVFKLYCFHYRVTKEITTNSIPTES